MASGSHMTVKPECISVLSQRVFSSARRRITVFTGSASTTGQRMASEPILPLISILAYSFGRTNTDRQYVLIQR